MIIKFGFPFQLKCIISLNWLNFTHKYSIFCIKHSSSNGTLKFNLQLRDQKNSNSEEETFKNKHFSYYAYYELLNFDHFKTLRHRFAWMISNRWKMINSILWLIYRVVYQTQWIEFITNELTSTNYQMIYPTKLKCVKQAIFFSVFYWLTFINNECCNEYAKWYETHLRGNNPTTKMI